MIKNFLALILLTSCFSLFPETLKEKPVFTLSKTISKQEINASQKLYEVYKTHNAEEIKKVEEELGIIEYSWGGMFVDYTEQAPPLYDSAVILALEEQNLAGLRILDNKLNQSNYELIMNYRDWKKLLVVGGFQINFFALVIWHAISDD